MHETKIPSSIELFVCMPGVAGMHTTGEFTKLGHFTLDDGSKGMHQQWELKTVYMDACCQYIKICLHKNYENKQNPFNQVAVVRIAAQGAIASDYQSALSMNIPSEEETRPIEARNMKIDPIPTNKLDPMIQDKVLTLEWQKEDAIVNEDFDEAKRLKNIIDKVKIIGINILRLEG